MTEWRLPAGSDLMQAKSTSSYLRCLSRDARRVYRVILSRTFRKASIRPLTPVSVNPSLSTSNSISSLLASSDR